MTSYSCLLHGAQVLSANNSRALKNIPLSGKVMAIGMSGQFIAMGMSGQFIAMGMSGQFIAMGMSGQFRDTFGCTFLGAKGKDFPTMYAILYSNGRAGAPIGLGRAAMMQMNLTVYTFPPHPPSILFIFHLIT